MLTVKKKRKATPGSFKKGHIGNPLGITAPKGFAPWKVRVDQLSKKYDTQEKLMALFVKVTETGKMKPSKEFLSMNPIDAGIIWQLIGALMGTDKRLERESFWDRMDGKPKENKQVRVITSIKDLSEEELLALAQNGD